jgi:hypothetical protein
MPQLCLGFALIFGAKVVKIFGICKFLDTENEVFCKFSCIYAKIVVPLQAN